MRSILAAVDRDERSKSVARKAVELARRTGAHLELFLCDAERAYVRQHQYDREAAAQAKELCLADSRGYLESLRRELAAPDVEITLRASCESPLYAGIVRAVEREHPDLVVRAVGREETARAPPLNASDWDLVSSCPAPLLLVHRKAWKERPVIAAAIDLSAGESPELAGTILRAAADVASSTSGVLKAVHACRRGRPKAQIETHRAALGERVRSAGIERADVHLVVGEPAAALRDFVRREGVDLIVLGALTHRETLRALVGTLTGRLIDTLPIDFLLVKSPSDGA